MSDNVPQRIGPIQLLREIGRGGMGVVYLATDTRLDRQVAIKALPEHLACDHDRLIRFQREAKVLASLNHPGIAGIYGLEQVDGRQYLVLEYVEGETLAQRLERGAMPVDEAIDVAIKIAQALEAAHEKGVIHRDLKPGNIMITPDGAAKVLDFGLARTGESASSTSDSPAWSDSPTATSPARVNSPTIPGAILGTAGYMSPEQARGKPVDKRSDIFSFGCVLYEMLTGNRPFVGETVADSLGATLHREPEWALLPVDAPRRLRDLLLMCLEKDVRKRLRDIADARLGIERAMTEPPTISPLTRRSSRAMIFWIAGLLVVGVAGGFLIRNWLAAPVSLPRHAVQFTINAPPGTVINPESVNSVISPDGRRVAFIANEAGQPNQLWVRDLSSLTSRLIEGSENAMMPFWSPDSRSIGFFANGLYRVNADGAMMQRLADAPNARGAAWSPTGLIIFAPLPNGPLQVVPQSGGVVTQALQLDASIEETGHRFPQFLPDGRHFLYASIAARDDQLERTYIARLGESHGRELAVAEDRITFAHPDWVLFQRSGVLCAQQFDVSNAPLKGEVYSTPIRPQGATSFSGNFGISASDTGAVAYTIDAEVKTQLVEFGSDGQLRRTLSVPPAAYQEIRVTDAGDRLVTTTSLPSKLEFRLVDLTRDGVWTRMLEQPGYAGVWSHDGRWVYFSSDIKSRDIFRYSPGSSLEAELVHDTGNRWAHVRDISYDGNLLLYSQLDAKNSRDLYLLDLQSGIARGIATSASSEVDARFSPDGRMLAIVIESDGRHELYVQTFPEGLGRVKASPTGIGVINRGGGYAVIRWSGDGKLLYFLDGDGRTIRSVNVTLEGAAVRIGETATVMHVPASASWIEIGPEAKSVYAAVRAPDQPPCSIAVSINWDGFLPDSARK